jgi:putative redox protein
MQVTLDWKKHDLSFSGTAPTGHSVDLSAYKDAGGVGDGFAPEELVALGLAGCTGMDVVSILRKKQQDVQDFQVRVTTEKQAEHPKVWTKALIEYIVTGNDVDPAAVERAVELSRDKYCLVQNMLKATVQIESRYEIKQP